MRIAFFVSAFPVVSETFIVNQITGLIDRGHEVDIFARSVRSLDVVHPEIEEYRLLDRVFCLNAVPDGTWSRFVHSVSLGWRLCRSGRIEAWKQLLRILFSSSKGLLLTRSGQLALLCRQLEQGSYDIVHAQYGTLGRRLIPLKTAGILPARHVTSFRGHDVTQHGTRGSGFYEELFARGDLFLPVSESLKRKIVSQGCKEEKIHVLHSGINCGRFRFRARTLPEGETARILTVARLVEMKGVAYGVEAVARLLQSGRKIQYQIAGDGVLRGELEQLIEKLGMRENIRLLGWKDHDELARLMEQAHILLTPSVTAANGEQEGIPNVAKEAMAMGIPVVSTYHSGIPELVEDGVSGYLAAERDVDALADSLARLLDHPERWPQMGRAGRKKVEEEFDMERLNDQLEALYRSLIT